MSTNLDPTKSFFQIETWYIEEVKPNGHRMFHCVDETNYYQWRFKLNDMKKMVTTWRQMTWKDHNCFLSASTTRAGINYYFYRDLKLKSCLTEWNVLDDEGNQIDFSVDAIDNLDNHMANYLLDQYEKECEMSSKDLDKLRKDTRAFFEGKSANQISQYVYEHILCYHYKWTSDYVRSLDYRDVIAHVQMCLTSDGLDKEFDIRLTGVDPSKPKHVTPEKVLRGGDPIFKQY